MNRNRIVAIGALIVFGPPIIVGLIVSHYFGFWLGVVSGGILLLLVVSLIYRLLGKIAREQESKKKDEHI